MGCIQGIEPSEDGGLQRGKVDSQPGGACAEAI